MVADTPQYIDTLHARLAPVQRSMHVVQILRRAVNLRAELKVRHLHARRDRELQKVCVRMGVGVSDPKARKHSAAEH